MKKQDREIIFNKYGGKCAYCGCELTKGWHVDEIVPCKRKYKTISGHYVNENGDVIDDSRLDELNEKFGKGLLTWVPPKRNVFAGYENPDALTVGNQMPACASCNINKHSDSLEDFRKRIKKFVQSLNEYSVQYKIAKRYGLINETDIEVKFYFETIN